MFLADEDLKAPEEIESLSKIGDQESRDKIANYLTSEHFGIRVDAAERLMELGDDRCWEVLAKAISPEDRDYDITGYQRSSVADTLGKSKKPKALELLLDTLGNINKYGLGPHDDDELLAAAIIVALGEIGDERAVGHIRYWRDNVLSGMTLHDINNNIVSDLNVQGIIGALKVYGLWDEELIRAKLPGFTNMNPVDYFAEEISWIKNQSMKEFTVKYLNDFPAYFMIKPASSTGKYHATWSNSIGNDNIAGGLAKHVKAMCYIVHELAEAEMLTSDEHDAALIATLGHDAIKYGFDGGELTSWTHESEGAEFFQQCINDFEADIPCADSIHQAIAFHQGRWADSDPPKVFPDDFDKIGQLVHRADMVVSRSKIKFAFFD